jgi:hypothetical protein
VSAATVTAHPMAELPGSRPSKTREVIHAVSDHDVRIGWVTRPASLPLCEVIVQLAVPEPGLFPPVVTCRLCLAIAAREHIEITGGQL